MSDNENSPNVHPFNGRRDPQRPFRPVMTGDGRAAEISPGTDIRTLTIDLRCAPAPTDPSDLVVAFLGVAVAQLELFAQNPTAWPPGTEELRQSFARRLIGAGQGLLDGDAS